ncbi:MAG: rRNA maturation RNase YbeY [Longimicrobiaceae bacterium]
MPVFQRAAVALEERPGASLLARTIYHGFRALLLVGVALFTYLLFPVARGSDFAGLEEGVVAPYDVIAEFTFRVPKSEDELLRERAEAASGVPPLFEYQSAREDSVTARVGSFFAGLDSVLRLAPRGDEAGAVREYLENNRVAPPPGGVPLLLDGAVRRELHRSIETAVRQLYPLGVVSSPQLRDGFAPVRVRGIGEGERFVAADSLLTPEEFYRLARERLPERYDAVAAELQRLVLIRFFEPSLAYNERDTEATRARARAAVDPIRATVLQGERVVGAAEQIGEREAARLHAYENALAEREGVSTRVGRATWAVAGAIIYNLVVLSLLGALFWFFRRPLYHDFRALLLLAGLTSVVMLAASLIDGFELPPELIPVTFAALSVSVLWDGRLGLVVALVLALLLAGQGPFVGLVVPFTVAVGGAAAAFSVRAAQRRSRTWLFVAIISAAYVLTAITLGLLRGWEPMDVTWTASRGVLNAVLSSLLAIGFIPLFEGFVRITTDQTLLELADQTRPRLKRLSLEAPGTYAHTVNVANLAEAACNAIGANGLLARVGVYYHDIGKLVRPQFFIENQPRGRNPHDRLKPAASATVVRAHVTEGIRMAEEDRLPQVIKDFILEHHGTQKISFFHDQAREEDPDAELDEEEFIYPGPKPRSRETAVVMLADSVESAARALRDPTSARLRELVDRIVAAKVEAGQLEEAPITLGEVSRVKQSLLRVLSGMYHHRIDYPGQELEPGSEEGSEPDVRVSVQGGDPAPPLAADEVSGAVREVFRSEGHQSGEVSVTFLDDAAIADLNRRYLHRDRPTDVLAFALHEDGEPPLGDVYVGTDQAERQAKEHGVSSREEYLRLVIHGTLHLLGHDHPEDAGRTDSPMWSVQEEVLERLLSG